MIVSSPPTEKAWCSAKDAAARKGVLIKTKTGVIYVEFSQP
jgi:hypothetical protein